MSKVLITRSTPAAAITVSRYLFQSCVKASVGGMPGWEGRPGRERGGVCKGIERVRWLAADAGVRRSNMRRRESDETEERTEGEWGE